MLETGISPPSYLFMVLARTNYHCNFPWQDVQSAILLLGALLKTVGKEENAGNQYFLFPTFFTHSKENFSL